MQAASKSQKASTIRTVSLILAASPSLLPLYAVLAYGVNFFYWDEWSPYISGLLSKSHAGILTLSDLTAQHNEHRIFVPKLIYLLVGWLTSGNVKVIMFLQWPVVVLTSLGILWLMLRTDGPFDPTSRLRDRLTGGILFKWFLCNVSIFSMSAWENWLFGLAIMNVLPMMFIVIGIIAMVAPLHPWVKLSIAFPCAFAASFTAGCGMEAWILIGLTLVWSKSWSELASKKWLLATWACGFLVSIFLYFWGYHAAHHPLMSDIPPTLIDRVKYVLVFIAGFGAYAPSTDILQFVGAVVLSLYLGTIGYFVYLWRSREFDLCGRMLIWISIGGFSLFNAVLGAAFRAGLGLDQASSSRYTTFALYLPVCLIVLIPMICADIRHRFAPRLTPVWMTFWLQFSAFLGCPIIFCQLVSLPQLFNSCSLTRDRRLQGKSVLMTLNVFPVNSQVVQLVSPEENNVRDLAPKLNEAGYIHPPLMISADARERADDSVAREGPAIAGVLEELTRSSPESATATGWAILPTKGVSAHSVLLSYDDAQGRPVIFTMCTNRYLRPDIVKQRDNSNYALCGWNAVFSADVFPAGLAATVIRAWAVDTDTGKLLQLSNEIRLGPK